LQYLQQWNLKKNKTATERFFLLIKDHRI